MGDDGLALVCASIGGLQVDDDGKEIYVKSPDCLESLRDLQRYLRRDHPETRDVFMRLGNWNIVRQDLVPIIKRYSDDSELVLNCVKVLVFLTMPVDPSSHQVSQQLEYLLHFKAAIVEGDAIAVIVSLLEEPLQQLESGSPKDDDWKMFQLFLTLIRNFLSFPNCLPQHGPSAPRLSNLRDQMLDRLFNESAMELVIALTQHVADHGGLRKDNLLILEIVQHVFSGQLPDLVAAAADKGDKGVKVMKQSEKSVAMLRAILQAEKEQLSRQRNGDSQFTGMFVKVARDGSKTILTRNPHQSPLENLIKKPQIKRGHIKRIVPEPPPLLLTSDHIYVLLKDFAEQFLASGYNILMQSVKEDIRRERHGFETPDVVVFFQVAQFFTSYRRCTSQIDQNQKTSDRGSLDGAENEAAGQTHLCGLIASTMDEDMFNMVISKWHEYVDSAEVTKDWGPAAAAGGTMKDMIRMLDLVLRRSGSLTKEGQQELRTARILLYKVLYDQTENGILHFVNSLIKLFDMYKQPRSHLADLVEITHIVLRILDGFANAGESLRVLKKVRGRRKNIPKPENTTSEQIRSGGAGQDATENQGGENVPEEHASDSPPHADVSTLDADPQPSGHEPIAEKVSATDGEAPAQEQCAVESEEKAAMSSHEEDEEENFHTSPTGNDGDDDSDREKQNGTKEVSLNIHAAVANFANNAVVRNYCWLLKFYSSNSSATNYYIARMLQRICEDCMLEPILYQISILQTFYSLLSNKEMQASEHDSFVYTFLKKLVRRLFKKLESQPVLFVDILFWKTRTECQNITADYMVHSLRKATGGAPQTRKRINIADALGDDEEEAVPPMNPDSDNERSAASSEDDDVQGPEEGSLFSEAQEVQIRDLYGRYKDDEQMGKLIALELDSSGQYTGAQVLRELQRLRLVQPTLNQSKAKVVSGEHTAKKVRGTPASRHQTGKRSPGANVASNKSKIFSEADDLSLRELFARFGSGKNVTKVITENLGGDHTTAQVSRRLRTLGLVKSKPRTAHSSLHANLTDGEEDDEEERPRTVTDVLQEEGNSGPDGRREKRTRKRNKNSVDLSDSEDDVPLSSLAPSRKRKHDRDEEVVDESRRFTEAQDQERRELFNRHGNGKNVTEVITENLDIATAPVSRRLRRIGLVRSKSAGSLPPVHHDLADSAEDEDHGTLRTNTDLTDEEGDPGPDNRGEKRARKRRINTVDLSDSDDNDGNGLSSLTQTLTQRLDGEDDDPLSGMSRPAPTQAQEMDSEDDVLMSGSRRQGRHLGNEDDIPMNGLSRSTKAPRQAEESDIDDDYRINSSNRPARRQPQNLESDDDVLMSGSSRPAPRAPQNSDTADDWFE